MNEGEAEKELHEYEKEADTNRTEVTTSLTSQVESGTAEESKDVIEMNDGQSGTSSSRSKRKKKKPSRFEDFVMIITN